MPFLSEVAMRSFLRRQDLSSRSSMLRDGIKIAHSQCMIAAFISFHFMFEMVGWVYLVCAYLVSSFCISRTISSRPIDDPLSFRRSLFIVPLVCLEYLLAAATSVSAVAVKFGRVMDWTGLAGLALAASLSCGFLLWLVRDFRRSYRSFVLQDVMES